MQQLLIGFVLGFYFGRNPKATQQVIQAGEGMLPPSTQSGAQSGAQPVMGFWR